MIKVSPINIKIWSRLGPCGAVGVAANELALTDDKVVFLTSDLQSYSGLDRFARTYSDKFINLGIAEENMINVGAGMSKKGFRPYCTTYATFASMRCADQIRTSLGYMNLNVKVIGLTAGLSVGILGATHISSEDIAVMRAIPNMTVISPADSLSTIKAILATDKLDGPCYIRLTGPMNNPIVYYDDFDFEIGKSIKLREGNDIAIVATGSMVYNALKVADIFENEGKRVTVIDMHTIKPLDKTMIDSLSGCKAIFTVEEHSIFGGLGGAVAEYVSSKRDFPPLSIIGLSDSYPHAANYDYLLDKYGLTIEKIYRQIKERIEAH